MKITLNVNISGTTFVIDEDAYRLLKNYLNDIEIRLSSSSETIVDIEARVAEILIQNGASEYRVVSINNVREIIRMIGAPLIFGNGTTANRSPQLERKLMRDPRHKILAGLCSGIGSYFEIGPILFRITFILLVIFFGSGFLIYLILWIVIPKAVTPKDFELLDKMKTGEIKISSK